MCDRSSDPTEHDAARERPSALDVERLGEVYETVARETGWDLEVMPLDIISASVDTTSMTTKTERIIAERSGDGWLVMWPDGAVEWLASEKAVLRAVQGRIGEADVLVSEVEWRR